MIQDLGIGSKLNHDRYGEGIVSETGLNSLKVFFRTHGEKEFSLDYEGFEVISKTPRPDDSLSLDDVERALAGVLQKFADFTPIIEIDNKWIGGTVILKPGNPELQSKEIPINTFFHKIVMVRDRLRVLEQNLNKSKNLSSSEKVQMQQYITRIYGSLTTFNVLFSERQHNFVGESQNS